MRRISIAGRLTSRAAFVVGLLVVAAVVFCGDEPVAVATPTAPSEPLKNTMHRLAGALLVLTAPEAEAPSTESQQREAAALDALAEGALSLQQHLVKREPGFVYRARVIAEEARRIRWLSSRGRQRQARERLDAIVLTCVSCHSRLPSDDAAILKGFVDQPHVRALPPHRAGPLLLAARQFDAGLTAYERALTSKDTPASSLRSMMATYLATSIRVQRNPERIETLVRFMQSRQDISKSLHRDLDHWALSLEYVGPRLTAKGPPLKVARQLVHDGDVIRTKADGGQGSLVHYAVASGLLLRALEEPPRSKTALSTAERAEAYFLLGMAEGEVAADGAGRALAASYFDASIRLAPQGPWAQAALEELRALTGSSNGTDERESAGSLENDAILGELERLVGKPPPSQPKR
jgi:hypothetical protein